MISDKLRSNVFLGIGFLVGSINLLYSELFYICLVLALLINLKGNWNDFWKDIRSEWKYVLLPLGGVVFLCIHYLLSLLLVVSHKTSWSQIESLVFYFFTFALYLVSVKNVLTSNLLKNFMLSVCLGVLVLNIVKFFYLVGCQFFVSPIIILKTLYAERFGMNMGFWGGYFYLEPQACYLAISALLSVFLLLTFNRKQDCKWRLVVYSIILLCLLFFLSLTVTKGAIIAFVLGFLTLGICSWKMLSWYRKWLLIGFTCLGIGVGIFSLSGVFSARYNDFKSELLKITQGDVSLGGGTTSFRLMLWKENFKHIDEFGMWGLGVYKKTCTEEWYKNTPGANNAHNSFIEYWVSGGILGLCFIFYYFLAPIFRMRKQNSWSALVVAIIVTLFVANNSCVLIILVDSAPFVILLLELCFLYAVKFSEFEKSSLTKLQIDNER